MFKVKIRIFSSNDTLILDHTSLHLQQHIAHVMQLGLPDQKICTQMTIPNDTANYSITLSSDVD